MDPIEIHPYDSAWPALFASEAERLRGVLGGDGLMIEHVGSTAVPGLAAKPVIDLLLVTADRTTWPAFVEPLEGLGYSFWRDNPDRTRLFFVKGLPPAPRRTHHVHVLEDGPAVREVLAFRDHLRATPDAAAAYVALKRELATRFRDDREGYTRAKGEFITTTLVGRIR